jgi:methionyl-tRNA formyltransferase
MRDAAPDWLVVIAYGRILKKNQLDLPRLGAINVHASLLPRYRGPAPIQWAIINGDLVTGVTTMMMDEGLDQGDILLQAQTALEPTDTSASLHDRLSHLGANLLLETLNRLALGDLTPTRQDHAAATYAPLLSKDDGIIQWDAPSHEIDARIRGVNPWPGAFTFLDGRRLKIYGVCAATNPTAAPPGTVLAGFSDELRVATADGALSILELQAESGRRMTARDYLKGKRIPPGTRLE